MTKFAPLRGLLTVNNLLTKGINMRHTVLKLLASSSFVTYNKDIAIAVGVEEAIMLGEIASEYDYWLNHDGLTPDGFFYSTIQNVSEKTGLSEHKQREAVKTLQKLGLLECKVKGIPATRHFKLNDEAIVNYLQNLVLEKSSTSSGNIQELAPENFRTNNNINNNNITNNNIISETSSPTENKSTSSKRISRKEQLVNYVNELSYSEETKKALFSWIFQIGLNGNVTVQQLQDKLKAIWNVYDDESLVRQSIEEAYRNNWFGFFPLKNRPTKSPATLEKKAPSSLVKRAQDNMVSQVKEPGSQAKINKNLVW